jgi:uncharacterized protein (TIGR03435 family)
MMGKWKAGLFLALAAVFAEAQEFEAASVRQSGPRSVRGSEGGPGSSDPGRYSFGRADLQTVIVIAYQVEDFQVSSRFAFDKEVDIVAKVPPGATKDQFRAMLRNLLSERFHLKLHIESKEFPAYALTIAKTGPKLKEASSQSEPAPRSWLQEGFPDLLPNRPGLISQYVGSGGSSTLVRMKGQQQPMARLAAILRQSAGQPVVDRTGLVGEFDFTLEFAKELPEPSADAGDAPVAPNLDRALQQQMGLQLIRQKLPFKVLVVDSVDPLPTEN